MATVIPSPARLSVAAEPNDVRMRERSTLASPFSGKRTRQKGTPRGAGALIGPIDSAAYGAAKAGVLGLTRAAALRWTYLFLEGPLVWSVMSEHNVT